MIKHVKVLLGIISRKIIPNIVYLIIRNFTGKPIDTAPFGDLKIAFIRPGKLGDLIVATPFFSALKKKYPGIYIAVICSPYNKIIVQHNPYVNFLKVVNFHSFGDVLKVIGWIRRNQFDWVVDLTPGVSRTSTLISRLIRSAKTHTAGMHKAQSSRYFDVVTDYHGIHIIDRIKLLIENVLHCKFDEPLHSEVYFLEEHKENARRLLTKNDSAKMLIGVNLSAGENERLWSREKYRDLILMINRKFNTVQIVLFSMGEQQKWAQEYALEMDYVVALPSVDLLTITAAIGHLSLFFSPDTSLLHIAAGLSIPVVGLYCTDGENLIRWRAYGHGSKELVARETNNVNEISVQRAFGALVELIECNERT